MITNLNPMKKTSATSLREEGARILSVFTRTKEDLMKLNNKQSEYLGSVDAEISRLSAEKSLVVNSIKENNKIVEKIEEFLG